MTTNEPDQERRSFSSRTPVNENPDKVVYRRGFVTRHQVTGWRFVMRRIASGIAMHDTRMLVDPLRTQSRAVLMGALLVITGLLGCFVLSFMRPNGSAGNNAVLADRSSAALYVRVGDQLHPVLNLTSARLIVGKPVNPTTVKSSELDRFPRGNLIGIPGAPERMVQNTAHDANWTVCDVVSGEGGRAAHSMGVTVIAGVEPDWGAPPSVGVPPASGGQSAVAAIASGQRAWPLGFAETPGFAGTMPRDADQAATGLAALAGDGFGGGPAAPMVPSTWEAEQRQLGKEEQSRTEAFEYDNHIQ